MKLIHSLCIALVAESSPTLVSTLSLPSQLYGGLSKRAQDAGLGIELETRALVFRNDDDKATKAPKDKVIAIKGAGITTIGGDAKASTDQWKLTAEHSGLEGSFGAGYLIAEFIVNGQTVKLGQGNGKKIGNEITAFLNQWKPSKSSKTEINIDGFDDLGQWYVASPAEWTGANTVFFGAQITTSMPLDAVYKLMKDAKAGKSSEVYASGLSKKNSNIHIVQKQDFADAKLTDIKENDITDDFLGFFTLLVSYAKSTKDMKPSEGPKHSLSVMPRTDFAAMYAMFKAKIEPQYQGGCWDLYSIVKALAKKQGDGGSGTDSRYSGDQLDTQTFKWTPPAHEAAPGSDIDLDQIPANSMQPAPIPPPPPPPAGKSSKRGSDIADPDIPTASGIVPSWPGSGTDLLTGTLAVKKWLDGIQDNDKDYIAGMEGALRFGQVGQLGDKMENIVGGRPAPIFEFRDLANYAGDKLGEKLGALEDAVVKAQKSGGVISRREVTSSLPDFSALFRRAKTSTSSQNSGGKKRNDSDKGKGGSCSNKCPQGQASATVDGKQQCVKDCPKGQEKSSDGTKCQPLCPDGQAKTGPNNQCQKCPDGKKPSDDKKSCVDDKCPDGQAKTGPNNQCQKCPDGKKPSDDNKSCVDDKCPVGQAKTGSNGQCQACGDGTKPSDDGKSCVDGPCANGEVKINGKCGQCPSGQLPKEKGDGCFGIPANPGDQKKQNFEAKKTAAKNGGSKGLTRALDSASAGMDIGAAIKSLLQVVPTTAWDYENNIDVCAVVMGTYRGGNCRTRVQCQIDGEKNYDADWQVCHYGGEQHFTDDRIGDFSVTFNVKETDPCPQGLCGPILSVANFNYGGKIDAEQEAANYLKPGGQGICHDNLTDDANDCSECDGKTFWWVCGVPNL